MWPRSRRCFRSRSTISDPMVARLLNFPLILILAGCAAVMMVLPAIDAAMRGDSGVARAFFYSGLLGLAMFLSIGLALSGRGSARRMSDTQNLAALLMAYILLPVYLALPFYEGVQTTSYLNAYVEMVSSFTT